jgi:hypothetical protein
MSAYRSDHEAALARLDVVERELAHSERERTRLAAELARARRPGDAPPSREYDREIEALIARLQSPPPAPCETCERRTSTDSSGTGALAAIVLLVLFIVGITWSACGLAGDARHRYRGDATPTRTPPALHLARLHHASACEVTPTAPIAS